MDINHHNIIRGWTRPVPRLFDGELALVTGAARGLGLSSAEALLASGCRVVMVDRDVGELERAAHSVCADLQRCHWMELDVTDAAACADLAAKVQVRCGPISVLVNNAGVASGARLGDPNFFDESHRLYSVNVMGLFNFVTAFKAQLEQTKGSIVNISSITALVAGSGSSLYAASKGAVTAATRALAKEFAPCGVRVNAIAPGLARTAMAEGAWKDEARLQKTIGRTLLGRAAEPEDIAAAVLYLASHLSGYVTGVTLPVDGGYTAN